MKSKFIKRELLISKIFIIIILLLNYIMMLRNEDLYYSNMASNNSMRKVNPIGTIIGLKMYTDGVLVVGMSEVESSDGKIYVPYKESGIKEGDMIIEINNNKVNKATEVMDLINKSKGQVLKIKYNRNGDIYDTEITPVKIGNGTYMIGLWIRDAAAGLGTLTYYEERNNSFAALGHGINDVDTNKLFSISNGELITAKIVSIVKGERGKVGEIRGIIDDGIQIGKIEKNTEFGVYGLISNKDYINSVKMDEVIVANRNQIKEGKAKIYCQLDNNGVKEYEIEIKKIYRSNSSDNKSMLIKITDENLLSITGGIIPGMSGTPIVQDGKFVGAITNVLLNNPTEGYAIFADMMER